MAFQPFGHRFEVHAHMPPSDVKGAIRRKRKAWFDATDGPRGWIAGPFLCLWSSAFDRYGPMLFGLIRQDQLGTRITGRAGSDLNGILMTAILVPGLLYLLLELIKDGQATPRLFVMVGIVVALAVLSFWWAHKDRKKANYLVRFVQNAVGEAPLERSISRRQLRGQGPPVKLRVDNRGTIASPTAEQIYEALDQLKEGVREFVILERRDSFYMQSAFHHGQFIVEIRDGTEETHRYAVSAANRNGRTVEQNEAAEALLHYVEGREAEAPVAWGNGYANV